MRVAVVGSGISGLTCTYLLAPFHDVTLFEKEDRLGGHTSTVRVQHEGRSLPVDMGFIVFNERNYPNFCRLLARLGVDSRPTAMSFSVRDDADGFEYGGHSLAGLLGTASNLFRRRWWSIVCGIARLKSTGRAAIARLPEDATIGDLCSSGMFSSRFLDGYLIPMAAAIWSAPRRELELFPARFFLRFFDNHGMLDLRTRPIWRTVVGGSHAYIDAMLVAIQSLVRVGRPVQSVQRRPDGAVIRSADVDESFDEIVFATHSDEALAALADPTPAETEILSAMPYQANDVVLHADDRLLPQRSRCWAAWNYLLTNDRGCPAIVTYDMTILQGLDTRVPLCVTLNGTSRIDPSKILFRRVFSHPLYTIAGESARSRWAEISGVNHTHYCGAYWGSGFHEDGVNSALRVCERLGVRL